MHEEVKKFCRSYTSRYKELDDKIEILKSKVQSIKGEGLDDEISKKVMPIIAHLFSEDEKWMKKGFRNSQKDLIKIGKKDGRWGEKYEGKLMKRNYRHHTFYPLRLWRGWSYDNKDENIKIDYSVLDILEKKAPNMIPLLNQIHKMIGETKQLLVPEKPIIVSVKFNKEVFYVDKYSMEVKSEQHKELKIELTSVEHAGHPTEKHYKFVDSFYLSDMIRPCPDDDYYAAFTLMLERAHVSLQDVVDLANAKKEGIMSILLESEYGPLMVAGGV